MFSSSTSAFTVSDENRPHHRFRTLRGDESNPSQVIAERLDGTIVGRHRIIGKVLACEFGKSRRQLRTTIARHSPSLVICLGLASGRQAITPERIAINIDDARIPDNAGNQPVDKPVIRGGPAAYWSTLPIKAIVHTVASHGLSAGISQSAGYFRL
ncbi:MAG: hypothetical protein QM755_20755 [Luteolibacter sp.]